MLVKKKKTFEIQISQSYCSNFIALIQYYEYTFWGYTGWIKKNWHLVYTEMTLFSWQNHKILYTAIYIAMKFTLEKSFAKWTILWFKNVAVIQELSHSCTSLTSLVRCICLAHFGWLSILTIPKFICPIKVRFWLGLGIYFGLLWKLRRHF